MAMVEWGKCPTPCKKGRETVHGALSRGICPGANSRHHSSNKCIGDDTKAAAHQRLNCIKNKTKKLKYGIKRFSIWRMEFLHPAMWQVPLES